MKKHNNTQIEKILPEGNIFGQNDSDEFTIQIDNEFIGVFKTLEYLSLPFSITGNQKTFEKLFEKAQLKGTSFQDELNKDRNALRIIHQVNSHMRTHPVLSKQILDHTLSRIYVYDNILASTNELKTFEGHLAKVAVSWKRLSDFYCIEGLVGGDGENNPFTEEQDSSFIAGGLDSLETKLPLLKYNLDEHTWKKICIQLSSVVNRDYRQIDRATDVLSIVFGNDREISNNEIFDSIDLVDKLSKSVFSTNIEIGKLYNTLVRFHNWLPLAIKQTNFDGDAYDSICIPSKKALDMLDESSDIAKSLSKITDATSPKGIGLVRLVDDGKIGNRIELIAQINNLEDRLLVQEENSRNEYSLFTLEDQSFYPGLMGGKWKGSKLLHDAKEAFGLSYHIPIGFGISSMAIESIMKERGISEILSKNIFSLDEGRRRKILDLIEKTDFSGIIDDRVLNQLGESIIVRSSMYGEDGTSNFSGTYDSTRCVIGQVEKAIKLVVKSYFSSEAVKSREDIGLAHIPGISLKIEEHIKGSGGVIHITDQGCSLSFSETPEDAVNGNGTYNSGETLYETITGTSLEEISEDLELLHDFFGNIDLEFVQENGTSNIYLIQKRPKYKLPDVVDRNISGDRITVSSISDLHNTRLDKPYVVEMPFLGKENINNHEEDIMNFIRENINYVVAVEGRMPSVAHIPNKIEGHFRIPYLFKGD